MTETSKNIVIDLIVPMFNESGHIFPHIENMLSTVHSAGYIPHIILVDDGSIDDTWNKIKELSVRHSEVEGIRLSRNFGKDQAIFIGLKYSHGQAAITIDSDGQHPIEILPEMLQSWSQGNLIVHAIKTKRFGESFWVKLRANLFNFMISKLMNVNLKGVSDYKLLDKKIVKILQKSSNTNAIYRFLVAELGFSGVCIPMKTLPPSRSSRWHLIKLFQLSIRAVMFHTDIPLKALALLIFLVALLTVGLFVLLMLSLIYSSVPKGYSTILVLAVLNLCITMMGITGLGVYLKGAMDILSRRTNAIEWEYTFNENKHE